MSVHNEIHKIPPQELALKMQGGLMREGRGGVFAGHYGTINYDQHHLHFSIER